MTTQSELIGWKPLPGFQERACESGAFECLLGGAAGPGKTAILVAKAAEYAQHPSGKVLFMRTSFKDTLDIQDRMLALYPSLGGKWSSKDNRWTFSRGGWVMIGHARTMVEVLDYLGPEYTAIMFDELPLLPEERVWQMLLGRIRSTDPTVPLRARASGNPIGPGVGWVMDRFITPCGEDGSRVFKDENTGRTRAFIPGTAKDNPLLPESYWDGLKDLPPSIQKALRLGLWRGSLGLFYPELADVEAFLMSPAEEETFRLSIRPHHEWWGGFDWGFSHPAVFGSYVRVGDLIVKTDSLYMHRFQDEEQAAMIKGQADPRSLYTVYSGHDSFAVRQAHSAAAETVADVFLRYNIMLTRANIDRMAGAKVVRRLIAPLKDDDRGEGRVRLKFFDTPGNRMALRELSALVPDERNPNVPAKRDADEAGRNGDDGADETRYAITTRTLETSEPAPLWQPNNSATGSIPLPWEELEKGVRMDDGSLDKRTYQIREGLDDADQQFDSSWFNS